MGLSHCKKIEFPENLFDNFQKTIEDKKVKFFSLFLLIALAFNLSSCLPEEEDSRRFKEGRSKREGSRKRTKRPTIVSDNQQPVNTASPTGESASESLIFPVTLSSEHNSLSLQSSDSQKFTISAEPKEKPINLVASLSGTLSITTTENLHTLVLSSTTSSKILYAELTVENTTLLATNGSTLNQKQTIATTKNPIVFYVKENKELTVLCFSINKISEQVQVAKNFTDHPNCK